MADRAHDLLQVYEPDGTFIKEGPTPGPINSVAFSADPDQYYVYGAGINAARSIIHPEGDDWRAACNTRLEDIRLARNPSSVTPGS